MITKEMKADFKVGIAIGVVLLLGEALKDGLKAIIFSDYTLQTWAGPGAAFIVSACLTYLAFNKDMKK